LSAGEAHEDMVTYLSVLLCRLLAWLPLAAGALYARMVIKMYRTDGPRCRPGFRLRDPARSAQHLAVWLGVKALEGLLGIARALLSMVVEASAEVGEWLMRRSPAMLEDIRSRFLGWKALGPMPTLPSGRAPAEHKS